MSNFITLTEAATFLGVSKATLRNWDNEGKLKATRNPLNGYRQYDLNDLVLLKKELLPNNNISENPLPEIKDSKEIKRAVNKLHCIIRDGDANSNIVTRFDEISKLLFLKLTSSSTIFEFSKDEDIKSYASKIRRAYSTLICSLSHPIPNQFSSINLNEQALYKCGIELSKLSLNGYACDVKGLAYEDTIRGTFDKSDNQQYFTPYQIVDFMVSTLGNFINGNVCDPACGTAGFLTKVNEQYDVTLYGFEVDERLSWVSTLNLFLHGANDFKSIYMDNGGSLGLSARKYFNTMDVILTNPPFGSDYTDAKLLSHFSLGKNKSSRRRGILFIEQSWNLLKDNGIISIIIDQGVLNSNANIDVRDFILNHFEIMGIIELPETAFLPYANVIASILILKKVKNVTSQYNTFFAKSENVGRKSNGDDDIIYYSDGTTKLNSDLPSILKNWYYFVANKTIVLSQNCFVTNIMQNLANDKAKRLDFTFHHPCRNESKALLSQSLYPLYTLSEICDERIQAYVPSADQEATIIPFTGLANIEAYTGVAVQEYTPAASIKSSVKRCEPQDVIFSKMRPALRKIAVINSDTGGYVSSECSVFTIRKNDLNEFIIQPELLSAILRSDFVYGQIMSCITGIGRPRISGKDLRNVKIPVPPNDIQKEAIQLLKSSRVSSSQLRERANALQEEASLLDKNTLNNIAKSMIGGN